MSSRIVSTPSEKRCLMDLINKYPAVLSISTNHLQLREKTAAWAKLTEDFNSNADNQKRTQAQLKKCWDNIKTKRKLELREKKRSRLKTGGGRLSPSDNEEHHLVDSVLDSAPNVELNFSYDSNPICQPLNDDTAVPSTSSSMPWTNQSTEVPVSDLSTPKESSKPMPLPTRRRIPKRDLIRSNEQAIQDEAELRCLRSTNLIKYDEEIHKLRLETAQEQLISARLQNRLLRLEIHKARIELKAAKRK